MIFNITDADILEVQNQFITSLSPLRIKTFPTKEKKKYIILMFIIKCFDKDVLYTEKEVNEILKPIYEDYVLIRRYLIDYQFLHRAQDGSWYKVNID